jgi:hypothetical protein
VDHVAIGGIRRVITPADNAIAVARAARNAGTAPPSDTERILAIPRGHDLATVPDGGAALVERWTRALALRPDAPRLKPLQAFACDAMARSAASGTARGAMMPIGVGHGKTLVTFLASEVLCAQRTLLLIPSAMQDQCQRDLAYWQRFYRFRVPTILPYGELSTAKSTDFLSYFKPDLIIADEAQALRHRTSARTKRVIRYFRDHPDTRFVPLSGTMTSKGLRDYSHLAELALRDFCPLPLTDDVLELWESCLNPDGEADYKAWDAIWPLVPAFARTTGTPHWRDQKPKDRVVSARVAFQRRLATVPGVVTSTDASIAATLYLVPRVIDVPAACADFADDLENTWTLPDAAGNEGAEEIADALTMARAAAQISAGFYYVWEWPGGVADTAWLDARRAWHRAVRGALRAGRAGYDSPLLVARAADRGEGSADVLVAWGAWQGQRHKKAPPTRAVWVSPYVVQDAVTWARGRGRPVLLWYFSRAVEAALAAAGIPVFGQGSDVPDIARHPIAALSINVHGKGKNLQAWSEMLVCEVPSSGAIWEQLIGRLHRQGQAADAVTVHVYQHTKRLTACMDTANKDAEYIEQTQGVAQRLNFGVWTTAKHADATRS